MGKRTAFNANYSWELDVETVFDATANDSNKSWTVPDNEIWKLNWAHVIFVSTATVGNRQVEIEINDGTNDVFDVHPGALQAASQTVHYLYGKGVYRETTVTVGALQTPIPHDVYLKGGYILKFWDSAAIDAAADDMTVSFQYSLYKA